MAATPVTFCMPELASVAELERLAPDRSWRAFATTRNTWIAQTYLRLRAAGHPVSLSRVAPKLGVIVFEASSRRSLFAQGLRPRALLAAVRADHRAQRYADVEIVQNDRFADDERVFFVPHWPQPGLIPRDPARGSAVRTIGFKGHLNSLQPELRSERWRGFLASLRIAWDEDGPSWRGQDACYDACRWNDFSQTDVVIAVRRGWSTPYRRKPASKLVNAWHAGVPAICGPEYAYRRLRRSPLDFLEVHSLEETMAAVRRLHADPELYGAMVANGRRRAREISVASVTRAWARLLFDRLGPRAEARARSRTAPLDRIGKQARHRLEHLVPRRDAPPGGGTPGPVPSRALQGD